MRTACDPDSMLVDELLAPPPVEDARRSFEYWCARRQSLPLYRRSARREADELAARWRERLRAAERVRFDASRPGRLLAAVGLSRYWPTRPRIDGVVLLGLAWRFAPRKAKRILGGAAAVAALVAAGSLALVVLAVAQLG